ncbi:flagellar hook-basal body complex protein FliE [Paenibacillus cisolokensis]|jgi:flagellar hook-basal body complex protein FliE|uniref:Flagellar hook-basal body complex protein FliE n=1 Tax=Paenibacillus cisolokensis TaxID=1658519 RepID=A0ABQ4NAR4_9BACL|nr:MULTISPECIES: flagellar hook-basal body complex protein FliE [Paenibacillus]ALS27544.1 flagellar hook-basal body protein FliE [Paenibacillus sp. 32O-W]GIQ65291.1 flagellar hook-basal body complex protein FliE [Paenibacillus cisolokensis]
MIEPMALGPVRHSLETGGAAIRKEPTPADVSRSFGEMLKNAIDGVSELEQSVHTMNDKFLLGEVDISQVAITAERALLSLQLTSQIRNKAVEAYQEIMRMQI